jgi:hypothetical protein
LTSPYYPPRARWYSWFFYLWFPFRRVLHLEKIHLPRGYSFSQFVLSLVLPGYACIANGRHVLGRAFMGVYFFSALVFAVALGYQLGNVGYGLMISAHASSLIFLESHWLRNSSFQLRFGLAVVTLLALWLGVYSPVVDFAQRHWLMPLQVKGEVVIVRRALSPGHIQRGDRVMYRLPESETGEAHQAGGAVWVRGGYGFGPVLALAGDRVEFSTNSYSVNGVSQPLLPYMPTTGDVTVAEKQWFVWPEFDINGHGNVNGANITAVMLQLATVSENQFVGRPFKHWFGRRQIIP